METSKNRHIGDKFVWILGLIHRYDKKLLLNFQVLKIKNFGNFFKFDIAIKTIKNV